MDTTTGMSAPPIGMMMSTPMTKASASMAKKAVQSPVTMKPRPRPEHGQTQHQIELVLTGKLDRRALEQAELVFTRELAKCDDRAAEGDGADGPHPRNSSSRLPAGMACPLAAMLKAQGSATAATAMNTAARPIMLCMKATSSGILVISTRRAITVPAVPPASKAPSTQVMPDMPSCPICPASLKIRAAVVTMATAMPTMPNRFPRIEVVGWLKPLSA